ncbi:MAP kinase, partial [Metschnikowia bicuspidata var. bicuspidata NRRL YB-4993]
MRNSNSKLSFDDDLKTISRDNVQDPAVVERLEWQSMLLSVLTGDVVRSEKTKIIDTVNPAEGLEHFLRLRYRENLWFGIRAKIFGRSVDDQKKITLYRRNHVDLLIDEVLNYEISYAPEARLPREQIVDILDRYERACELWRALEDMKHDKPTCRDDAFQDRIDALTAWLSISDAIERESRSFKAWIGNDDLDVTRGRTASHSQEKSESLSESKTKVNKIFEEDNKSLAERIVKEKDVSMVFRKRIFLTLAPWMVKSKKNYIRLGTIFETLKLPDYVRNLIDLCLVPMRLIKEIIESRIKYAMKLQNPTLMMIDQMIDDFKSYIAIALEVKGGIIEYCRSDVDRIWIIKDMFEKDIEVFDQVVLQCVRYYLHLLNKKLNDSSRSPHLFRTNKEPEELESAWNFLRNLGEYIDGGGSVVAESVTSVTSRLCHKLLAYLHHQVNNPATPVNGSADFTRWYTSTTENFGQLRRKLARFTGQISQKFTNSFVFEVYKTENGSKSILEILKDTNHFLVNTNTVEAQGMYFFASPELIDNEAEILRIINGSCIGSDPEGAISEFAELVTAEERDYSDFANFENHHNPKYTTSYVITYCPTKPIVWKGDMIKLTMDNMPISDVRPGQMLLISNLPHFSLHIAKDRFLDAVSDNSVNETLKAVEQRSSLTKVHQELTKINKLFFRMTLAVFDSVSILTLKCRQMFPEGDYQELVNSYFIHARDFGKSSVKWSDASKKSTVIMRLIRLAIDWVSFICDDCVPTDRKTFRWCVLALEFAMEMTRGFNILVLDEDQFYKLKLKVARCMSLLISHFDIMGARSSEAEQRRLLKWYSQRQGIEKSADDDEVLSAYQEDLMAQISEIEAYRSDVQEELNSIGRVLDVSDLEYQFVTLLASSFSSVSIRWQKGKFIGGGSFGQVYAAVNLDTGGVMAVKEIVFHDSQSLKLIPSIKEEMTVLEMLNHPNVVQYFGVEVHRDKVYIFMEFCEGGSLSGLLAHGRIEDEMVIQVYTLQMLEGLAYLHQSGVVHRDIKPENILLDHNGVIKFVDFGAAKVIAASGKTRNTASHSSRTGTGGNNPQNLNSMTGTPMYMSPEVITGQSSSKSGVVDIWSLGCCVLEMATGRRPWANLDNEWAIMYHIAAGHKPQLPSPDQLSEEGIRFLSRCLEHEPSKRPSSTELLNDPWIVQIRQVAFGSSDAGNTPLSE